MSKINVYIAALFLWGIVASVQADDTAKDLYKKYQHSVYRIEVISPGMENKASLGTGFLIGQGDVMASNFHVISNVVHEPDRYKLEWVSVDGRRGPLSILGVDVVHDLSLLKAEENLGEPLVTTNLPDKGAQLYSMGHPLALDLSIVSGTANGLLEKSIYEKIHFSGSINPGMSGGPTLDADGQVVGINVATAGNSVGFLVPAHYLDVLLQRVSFNSVKTKEELQVSIGDQLVENQENLISELLANDWPMQTVGSFRVPGEISNRLDCWGDTQREEGDRKFHQEATNCNGQDSIYLSQRQRAGSISHQYFWFESESLSPRAFYNVYRNSHSSHFLGGANESDVGDFHCSTRFATISGQSFKVNVCARAYKLYPELTDFMVLMAMTGHEKAGFMYTLDLSTVTLDNGLKLFEKFLEHFEWIN